MLLKRWWTGLLDAVYQRLQVTIQKGNGRAIRDVGTQYIAAVLAKWLGWTWSVTEHLTRMERDDD